MGRVTFTANSLGMVPFSRNYYYYLLVLVAGSLVLDLGLAGHGVARLGRVPCAMSQPAAATPVVSSKLVLLGDTSVGKSCLVVKFCRNEFCEFFSRFSSSSPPR